jgi:hypothetical protein
LRYDPLENKMAEEDRVWAETIAGDDTDKLEALKGFENPGALFDAHQSLVNADWRDGIAGDDDKFKSQLERYTTPLEFGASWREQRSTISAGKYSQPLAEGATDDDIKAYREANGIPLESSGYMENLPEGMVVGEGDKEIMGSVMEMLHGYNVKPEVGHGLIKWYNGFAEDQQDTIAETDATHHQETEDKLRETWGSDYRANINLVGALIESSFDKEVKEAFLNARDDEGRAIMNIPGIVTGLAEMSRKLNPVAQLTAPTGDPAQTLNDEIAKIEKFMRDKRSEYMKDEPMQKRLRELYDIRTKHEETHKVA